LPVVDERESAKAVHDANLSARQKVFKHVRRSTSSSRPLLVYLRLPDSQGVRLTQDPSRMRTTSGRRVWAAPDMLADVRKQTPSTWCTALCNPAESFGLLPFRLMLLDH
ncbi:hypothetical protein FOL46_003377, partial [Perkinsus olseni]